MEHPEKGVIALMVAGYTVVVVCLWEAVKYLWPHVVIGWR